MCTTVTRKEEPIETKTTPIVTQPKPTPPEVPYHRLQVYTAHYKINYDYLELLNEEKTIINLRKQKCRLNIIISSYRRDRYTQACVRALEQAMCSSDLSVKITLIQIEDTPTLKRYADIKDLDYIFLHIDDIKTENQFSKALAYDIAYLLDCNMSEMTLFQDSDLIVTDNFFKVLDKYYLDKLSWLQAFCKKSVIPIHYKDTVEILDNNILDSDLTYFLDSKNPHLNIIHKNKQTVDYKVVTQGACGGSILIKNSLYEKVGGMDPEICYGYTIEDSLFWGKLITTKKKVNRVNSVHQTNHEYADVPFPLYQYHLYHLSAIQMNPLYRKMSEMNMEFLRCRHLDKVSYIEMKQIQFAENKKIIQENYE